MNTLPSMGGSSTDVKLNNTEKITSWVIFGALAIAGTVFWANIVPFIVRMLLNTWTAIGLIGGLLLLVAVLMNNDFRRSAKFLFKMVMRNLAGLVVQIDPIAIMKIAIADMRKEQEKIGVQIMEVNKQKGVMEVKFGENAKEAKDLMDMALAAKQQSKITDASRYVDQAQELSDFNGELTVMINDARRILVVLDKIDAAALDFIKRQEFTVKKQEARFKIIKSTHSAMKTAMAIFKGQSDESIAMIQAADVLREDMGKKVGEIQMALRNSSEWVSDMDISKGARINRGMAELEKYERGDLTLIQDARQIKLETGGQSMLGSPNINLPGQVPTGNGAYGNLFD